MNIGKIRVEMNREIVSKKRNEWRLLGKLNRRRYSQEQDDGGEERYEQLPSSAKAIDKEEE